MLRFYNFAFDENFILNQCFCSSTQLTLIKTLRFAYQEFVYIYPASPRCGFVVFFFLSMIWELT